MAFWERNMIVIGLWSLISALVYFGAVTWQSLTLGMIVQPQLVLVLGCVMLQVFGSALGMLVLHQYRKRRSDWNEADLPDDGMDERDRYVKLKSEASASHFYSLFFFTALLAWFAHENAAILFHSLVGAFYLGDICRTVFQLIYYNKAD